MDGQNRRVVVSDGIGLPNALTYDSSSGQVCWADAGNNLMYITCIEEQLYVTVLLLLLKGCSRSLVTAAAELIHLFFFFLRASGTKRLECVFPDGSGRKVIHPGLNYPFSMVYYRSHFYYTDWRR